MPHRIVVSSRPPSALRTTGAAVRVAHHRRWVVGEYPGHGRQVADVLVDDPEQPDDCGLAGGDAVEVTHAAAPLLILKGARSHHPNSPRPPASFRVPERDIARRQSLE
jgi:hypothetical protein